MISSRLLSDFIKRNTLNKYHFIQNRNVASLKKKVGERIKEHNECVKAFRKEHNKTKHGEVVVGQIFGGMRGIVSMICETSYLDPEEGIRFRGYTIPECRQCLPKAEGGEEPLPEGLYWLLLTSDIPTKEQVQEVSCDLVERAKLPDFITKMLMECPKTLHPMAQFSMAITALNHDSHFVKAYDSGVKKTEYWEHAYEDAMDLIARLPIIAAIIYNHTYKDRETCLQLDSGLCWTANFCRMLQYDDPKFIELLRLYLTIHSDHESGNVSAHTVHLVASALSDPYLAFAAGMNGLAGPLHGLANQEVLVWIRDMQKEIGNNPPEDKIKEYVEKTLQSGKVVPGYGHAVLRKTDPRFIVQKEFAEKNLPTDETFQLVSNIFKVVPPILQGLGKVQNPWPNVDAHSGCLLQYYGMTEMKYYTVLFGVSRALGVMASLIWSRGMGLPLERPKSITSEMLMEQILKGKDGKK